MLAFPQTLLGDGLDKGELAVMTKVVITSTQTLGEDLKARFGGRYFHDD